MPHFPLLEYRPSSYVRLDPQSRHDHNESVVVQVLKHPSSHRCDRSIRAAAVLTYPASVYVTCWGGSALTAQHRGGCVGGCDIFYITSHQSESFRALHLRSPMTHWHYDIYRDRLATTYPALGHALWAPNPQVGQGPVKIGDVGYVREGKFIRLFNALLPASDASHEGIPLPEHYKPLVLDIPNPVSASTVKPNQYCSAGVNISPPVPEYIKSP